MTSTSTEVDVDEENEKKCKHFHEFGLDDRILKVSLMKYGKCVIEVIFNLLQFKHFYSDLNGRFLNT